jgi:hypothetical protein
MAFDEGLKPDDDVQTFILSTEDCKEGFSAFKARRAPEWKGR